MAAGLRGGEAGGEARAVEAVHAQPVFRTPVMARAESHSGRVAERWAPEGQGAARAPAMRSLGFADRVIVNYLGSGRGEQAGLRAGGAARRAGSVERQVAPMDWLFPVPWYLDELDWVSAARAAAWESERAAVRSGEVAAARPRAAEARREVVSAARAEARPEVRFDLPLELVAPSLAAARASERGGAAAAFAAAARHAVPAPAWRAYSPMVDPAAARAAEFLAELVARSAESARISPAAAVEESEAPPFRPAPILEYVAPSELAGSSGSSSEAQRAHVASVARQTLEEARQAQAAATARAQAMSAQAQAQAAATAQARARAQAEAATQAPTGVESERAVSGEAAALEAVRADHVAAEASREEAARLDAIAGERARLDTVRGAEAARAEAVRAESARVAAQEPAPVRPATASRRAVELLAMSALAGGEPMAPSAGPRVLMPAGLGGLIAATRTSRAVHEPVYAAAATTPRERAGQSGRAWSFASARPVALDHLLWSDRWLARFAGASGGALSSFDVARAAPAMRTGAAAEWQPAWVSPQPFGRVSAASAAVSAAAFRAAPERVLTAPVLDDDQPVGDDVFGAIAAAAAADRHRRKSPPRRPRPAAPAEPVGPFRMPAADRALARVAISRSAGLGPSLGASPIAALLANLFDAPTQATFDARPLSIRSVSDFLARGAAPSRGAATPSAVELARRAPGSIWLSMPSAAPAGPWRAASRPSAAALSALPARTPAIAAAALAGSRPALSVVAAGARDAGPSAAPGLAPAASASPTALARSGRAAIGAGGPLSASPGAARPGAIAGDAEMFARVRSLAIADLALDFLSPEVLVAARSFGFGPVEAVRAQRLAAGGRPEMARLASMVDQVFVAALSPGQAAPATAGRSAAGELSHVAPLRAPRGSFLLPAASSRALGLTPGQAEQARPGIGAALDLVAAGQVAEIAAQQRTSAAAPGSLAADQPGGAIDPSDPVVGAALAARHREAATQERGATDAARAMLPPHLWSVFDAVYLSLGEETTASDVRPLAPAARAARALALASRARGPEDLPLSARARAAAAWAVLPVVMTGGAAGSATAAYTAGPAARRGSAAARREGGVDAPLLESAPARDGRASASRAGTALATLVAPSFFRGDERGDGYAPYAAERARAAVSTTFVETGSSSRPAPAPRPAPPPPPPRPAPAPAPAAAAAPSQAQFDAWFKDAAKKYFGEAPSSSGLTAAEMTLVTSAPRTQIAASPMSASRPTQSTGGAAPASTQHEGPAAAGPGKPDIDKIAQDVYDQVLRMLDVARERNGDPWSR